MTATAALEVSEDFTTMWQALRVELLRVRVPAAMKEDLVQDALLRVLVVLGNQPKWRDAVRFGVAALKGMIVNQLRKKRPLASVESIENQVSRAGIEPESCVRPLLTEVEADLGASLGPKGMALVEALLLGARENKPLARVLGTDAKSIRRDPRM